MADDLAGRVALVTGAGRRLGRTIALALAEAGAAVAVHYRLSAREADAVVAEIAAAGGRAEAIAGDLARPGAPGALVDEVARRFGRLDILVNNASVFHPSPLDALSEAAWDELQAINLRAPVFCALAAGRVMGEGGTIVNLTDASVDTPWPSYLPYQTAKAGLAAATLYLARALAPRVRVNAVAPGPILPAEGEWAEHGGAAVARAIARVPLGRWGEPADVARAVLFLVHSPYLTGVVVPVDGGRRLG